MTNLITRPEDLSAEWMTDILRRAGALPSGSVSELDYRIIGTGKMGDNARFTLQYDGAPAAAPGSVVVKFPAADDTARAMAAAQGAYYNEVMFYRHLAQQTAMHTPHIYANDISEDRQHFIIVMQDLAPAEPGSQLQGASRAQVELAMREAAQLAAAFYGNASLSELDYVMSPGNGGAELAQQLLQQSWPGFTERFGEALSQECLQFGSRYVDRHQHFAFRFQGPKTLAHGDFRCENILFGRDAAYTVDWQTAIESSPLTDLSYFLGSSVDVEDRRRWERELVADYQQQLAALGVKLSLDECWSQYREQSMHGLMLSILGASFSSPEPRSDAMFQTMIQRQLQHCLDVDAEEFLR